MNLRSCLLLFLSTTALLTSSRALTLLPPGEPSECPQSLVALPPCDKLTLLPPGEPSECSQSLVALPPCDNLRPPGEPSESAPSLVGLSYIGGPPNRAASAPSDISCAPFYLTIMTTVPACVGYLVWDPLTLGFPINTGRPVAIFPSSDTSLITDLLRFVGINPSPTPCLSYIDGPPKHVASAPSDIKTTYPQATTPVLMSSDQLTIRPPGEPSECAPSLITLSYIGGPPNRAASAPSDISCATFYQTITTTGPTCVCYLVRDPLTLGFLIDTGRLVTMFPSSDTSETG